MIAKVAVSIVGYSLRVVVHGILLFNSIMYFFLMLSYQQICCCRQWRIQKFWMGRNVANANN